MFEFVLPLLLACGGPRPTPKQKPTRPSFDTPFEIRRLLSQPDVIRTHRLDLTLILQTDPEPEMRRAAIAVLAYGANDLTTGDGLAADGEHAFGGPRAEAPQPNGTP